PQFSQLFHLRHAAPQLTLFSSHLRLTPRTFPSFPTRRSSDLYTGEPLVPLKGFPGVVWQRSKKKKRSADDPFERFFFFERCQTTDRKSTRLNSSHGSISYAVFCLKKKK